MTSPAEQPIIAAKPELIPRCFLKAGRETPLEGFHPWVFSGAVQKIDPCKTGDLVRVFGADKRFFGSGFINPDAQILIRMVTFEDEPTDAAFFERRIFEALDLRRRLLPKDTNAFRLVNSEGDFLPGLVADCYGDTVVLQIHTAGMDRRRDWILAAIKKLLNPKIIYDKSDTDARRREGLAPSEGDTVGAQLPEQVEIMENGHRFKVDIRGGQKTGFFLDQRDNRERVGLAASGRRVLNTFCYTGGFSVYAAKGGAKQIVSVDISGDALELAAANFTANDLSAASAEWVKADVFDYLRKAPGIYDLIVLDPPAFCKRKEEVADACRGYKDIHLQAFKKSAPGALIYTYSCSSHMTAELFRKVVFGAAKDAGRAVRVLSETSHPVDHPVSLYHPEGNYLKGLILEVGADTRK